MTKLVILIYYYLTKITYSPSIKMHWEHTQHTDCILMHNFFTKSIEICPNLNRIDKSVRLRLLPISEICVIVSKLKMDRV